MLNVGVISGNNHPSLRKPSSIRRGVGRVGAMKTIDIKSLLIGVLLTSTIFLGVASTDAGIGGSLTLKDKKD